MNWGIVVRTMLFSLAIAVQGVHFRANAMQSNKPLKIMRTSDAAVIAEVLVDHFDELTGVEMQHCLDVLKKENNSDLYDQAYLMIKDNEKYREFLAADEKTRQEAIARALEGAEEGAESRAVKYVEESPREFMTHLDSKQPEEVIEFLLTYARSLDEDAIALCLSVLTKPEDIERAERIVKIWREQNVESVPKVRPPGRNVRFSPEALTMGNTTGALTKPRKRAKPVPTQQTVSFFGSTPVTLQGGAEGPQSALSEENQELEPFDPKQFDNFIRSLDFAGGQGLMIGFYNFWQYMTIDQLHRVLTRLRELKSDFFSDALEIIKEDETKFSELRNKYPEYDASSQSVSSAEEARFFSGGVTFDRLEKLMQDNPTLYDSVVQRLRSSGELKRLNLVAAVDRLDRVRDEMIRLAEGAGRAELAEPKRMSGSRNLTEEGE